MLETAKMCPDRRIVGFSYPPGRTGDLPFGVCGAVTEIRYHDVGVVIVEDGKLLDEGGRESGSNRRRGSRLEELTLHLRRLTGFAPLRHPAPCPSSQALVASLEANDAAVRRFVSWSLGAEQYKVTLTLDPKAIPLAYPGQSESARDRGEEIARFADVWGHSILQFLEEVTLQCIPGVTRRGPTFADHEVMILEATFLVAVARRLAFHQTLDSLRPDLSVSGMKLEVVGPAAATTFAPTLDQILAPARQTVSAAKSA